MLLQGVAEEHQNLPTAGHDTRSETNGCKKKLLSCSFQLFLAKLFCPLMDKTGNASSNVTLMDGGLQCLCLQIQGPLENTEFSLAAFSLSSILVNTVLLCWIEGNHGYLRNQVPLLKRYLRNIGMTKAASTHNDSSSLYLMERRREQNIGVMVWPFVVNCGITNYGPGPD